MASEALLRLLFWAVLGLSAQMVLLVMMGAWIQIRRNRFNRLRIACYRKWEDEISRYAFTPEPDAAPFLHLGPAEKRILIPFLIRVLGTIGGSEGESVRDLYHILNLQQGLAHRLASRKSKLRAMAALEVGSFQVQSHFQKLVPLLQDSVPHVAHAAARSLALTGDLNHVEAVMEWVLTQEVFQQERLLWILESFGPEVMEWMEARLDDVGESDPWLDQVYALLAASTRRLEAMPRLLHMLSVEQIDVQAAVLKALGALGQPEALPQVQPFAHHTEWVLRAQAAKVLGILGGVGSVPDLLELLQDSVFDVRRNAAYALSQMSAAGMEALRWVAADPQADPFARDLAEERIQWAHVGGRG